MATVVDYQSNMAALFKRLQPQHKLEQIFKQGFACLNVINKKSNFVGSQVDFPWEYDHSTTSRTYASADTYAYPSSSEKPVITRKSLYGIGYLDAETVAASKSTDGAWVEAVQKEQRSVLYGMRKRTALSIYRGSGGAIGQVSAIANGDGTNDRITLTNKQDAFNFSRGQAVQMDTVDGGGTVHAGLSYVRKIDFTNGYLYMGDSALAASNVTTDITGAAANDYIFAHGDYGNSINGFAAYIPLVTPTAGESFLGSVDRSLEPERLAGHRLNDTSLTREEIVQDLAMRCSFTGAMAGGQTMFMSPAQVKEFALEMDTKVTRDPGGKGRVGFSGICVDTAGGVVEVLGDPACPETLSYLIDPSCWTFRHLRDFTHLVTDDGLTLRVVHNADQVQFRYRHWGNMQCTAPGKNAVAALPAVL